MDMSGLWEIQKVMDNPYTKVKMYFNRSAAFGGPVTVEAYMTDESFPFSTSASYGNALDAILDATSGNGMVNDVVQAGQFLSNMGSAGGFSRLVQQTIKKWDGSDAPQFSVGLLFVALNPTDNTEKNAALISSMTLPRIPGNGTDAGSVLFEAPMGYKPIDSGVEPLSNLEGTCTLAIGKWFEAFGLLIEAADFESSKECIANGSPLFTTGKVSFSTYREISYEEWLKFFKNVSL